MKKKGIQWKRKGKVLAALIACMVLCLGMTSNAWAYFNRGTVGISTGTENSIGGCRKQYDRERFPVSGQ